MHPAFGNSGKGCMHTAQFCCVSSVRPFEPWHGKEKRRRRRWWTSTRLFLSLSLSACPWEREKEKTKLSPLRCSADSVSFCFCPSLFLLPSDKEESFLSSLCFCISLLYFSFLLSFVSRGSMLLPERKEVDKEERKKIPAGQSAGIWPGESSFITRRLVFFICLWKCQQLKSNVRASLIKLICHLINTEYVILCRLVREPRIAKALLHSFANFWHGDTEEWENKWGGWRRVVQKLDTLAKRVVTQWPRSPKVTLQTAKKGVENPNYIRANSRNLPRGPETFDFSFQRRVA